MGRNSVVARNALTSLSVCGDGGALGRRPFAETVPFLPSLFAGVFALPVLDPAAAVLDVDLERGLFVPEAVWLEPAVFFLARGDELPCPDADGFSRRSRKAVGSSFEDIQDISSDLAGTFSPGFQYAPALRSRHAGTRERNLD